MATVTNLRRLLIVDVKADPGRAFILSAKKSVKVVEYDSVRHAEQDLITMTRKALIDNNQAQFKSVAIVLTSPGDDHLWAWTKDIKTIDQLGPIVNALMAVLNNKSTAHIDLLACNLATAHPRLAPKLTEKYGVKFRVSTIDARSGFHGGVWSMNNDVKIVASYFNLQKLGNNTDNQPAGAKKMPSKQQGQVDQTAANTLAQIHQGVAKLNQRILELEGQLTALTPAETPQEAGQGRDQGQRRLLVIDNQVSPDRHLAHAALPEVVIVEFDSKRHTTRDLIDMVRQAHFNNKALFKSIAIAQHGPAERVWTWTVDLCVVVDNARSTMAALQPIMEVLVSALAKTRKGKSHIDFLACRLHSSCPGLVPELEKMYGVDVRASTDDTGNVFFGGDWLMETDNDYDVSKDYLDPEYKRNYDKIMYSGKTPPEAKTPAIALFGRVYEELGGIEIRDLEPRYTDLTTDGHPQLSEWQCASGYDNMLKTFTLDRKWEVRFNEMVLSDTGDPEYSQFTSDGFKVPVYSLNSSHGQVIMIPEILGNPQMINVDKFFEQASLEIALNHRMGIYKGKPFWAVDYEEVESRTGNWPHTKLKLKSGKVEKFAVGIRLRFRQHVVNEMKFEELIVDIAAWPAKGLQNEKYEYDFKRGPGVLENAQEMYAEGRYPRLFANEDNGSHQMAKRIVKATNDTSGRFYGLAACIDEYGHIKKLIYESPLNNFVNENGAKPKPDDPSKTAIPKKYRPFFRDVISIVFEQDSFQDTPSPEKPKAE